MNCVPKPVPRFTAIDVLLPPAQSFVEQLPHQMPLRTDVSAVGSPPVAQKAFSRPE
jgi:hypothetical protein